MSMEEESPRRIAGGLARLGLALKAQSWRGAQALGLTPTQGQILEHLAEHPDGLKLAEIAAKLGISAPTASEAVTTLHTKQFVKKNPGADKRAIKLTLTREGEQAAASANEWSGFLAETIGQLPEYEQSALLSALSKVIWNLQIQDFIAPQRLCVTCAYFRPFVNMDTTNPHRCELLNTSYGAMGLRLNCPEHEEVPDEAVAAQ
jgi:DNA-binding MarR family transcriptional regulator